MANYVLKGFGKISRIINNPIRRYPNLDVDGSKMPLRFVFLGEFGTELILWLPYLKFLKSHTSFPFKTVGRPGSSLFYSFSDEHYEVDSSLLGDSWGTFTAYYAVKKMFPQDTIVCFTPGEVWPNPRQICVDGYELTNHNSHDVISLKNWEKLSFDFIEPNNPFGNKPFVVINNKVFRQWGMTKPVNTFSVADLVAIRDFFTFVRLQRRI